MKKVIVALGFALMGALSVHAQDKSVRLGIKVSPNMGFIRSDVKELKADGTRIGYTFGLMADFMLGTNQNYAFSTGLYLNNVGGKFKSDISYTLDNAVRTGVLSTELSSQYVEVPVTIKLLTNEIGYMKYFGQLGFGAAFNVADKATTTVPSGSGLVALDKEDYKDNIALFKASLIVGLGMEYNFSGATTLMVGVNYNNGFTNLFQDVKVGEKDAKAKQHYLELNLGMFF